MKKKLLIIIAMLFFCVAELKAQCTNESVTNGTFNTNIANWTRSSNGWEYRAEHGGIIRNWLDNGIDTLSQDISNINVVDGYFRLTFDVKMTRVNNTNSSLIVRFGGVDHLSINVLGSNSSVTPVAQNGSMVSRGATVIQSGQFRRVSLLIPHTDGLTSGRLQFVHVATGSQNDVELDNISVSSPCTVQANCEFSTVRNGTFDNDLNGWTISGAGAGNWFHQTDAGGRVRNNGDNTDQTMAQTVQNIEVVGGRVELSFDVIMRHISNCTAGTKLEVRFAGVHYLTITMFTSTNIDVAALAGASVTATPDPLVNNGTSNIKLSMPWAGASPASGELAFTHNTVGCSSTAASDVMLDNIFMRAPCICTLSNSGNDIEYCQPATQAIANCGEQYYYYLPAVANNSRNSPSKIDITTEMPAANVVIRNADGTVANTGTVNATAIYTYNTLPGNMFTSTYREPFDNRGFIIESDQPLTVRWTQNHSENQSLVVLGGKNALGMAFRVASVMNTTSEDGPHFFTVMATEDNTLVQMGAPLNASVTLNRGQQYTYSVGNIPVSGILILSDKQVVVNSGQQHKNISNGSTSKEATNIQVLPISGLGQEYIVVTTQGYHGYQVVAVNYNTQVRVDGELIAVLHPGESFQHYVTTPTSPSDLRYGKPYVITTSSPAYVYNLGTNNIGEFEMFQAPALDLPIGKASKVVYSNQNGQSGWVIVDQVDATKLKRNGSASLGTVFNWTLPASGTHAAKQVVYWHGGFAPGAINDITCDNCNSMYVAQLRDNGLSGAQIGYISGFDASGIQFYNTNLLPEQLLTYGYLIDTVDYSSYGSGTLTHTLTEAVSGGNLNITGVSLSRTSGNTNIGAASFSGLDLTITLPPPASVPAASADTLSVFVTTQDISGTTTALCMDILLMNSSPLPVDGLVFDAEAHMGNALLLWSTSSEQNNKGFAVEHSADAKIWRSVGYVKSKAELGNSKERSNYEFLHKNVVKGNNFYRLKQTDIDGRYEYSIVRMLHFASDDAISIAPNPTSGKLTISNLEGGEHIAVYDMTGREVLSARSKGTSLDIDMSLLMPGVYSLNVTNTVGKVSLFKLVKQ